jgi:hypothetical protein
MKTGLFVLEKITEQVRRELPKRFEASCGATLG